MAIVGGLLSFLGIGLLIVVGLVLLLACTGLGTSIGLFRGATWGPSRLWNILKYVMIVSLLFIGTGIGPQLAGCVGCVLVIVDALMTLKGLSQQNMLRKQYSKIQTQCVLWNGLIAVVNIVSYIKWPIRSADRLIPVALCCVLCAASAIGFSVYMHIILQKLPSDSMIKANAEREKAQAKIAKAAIRSTSRGAAIGATVSGTMAGMKVGATAASTENLLMQTEHMSRVNETLATANITEEQAKYIQEQTMKGHEVGKKVNDALVTETAKLATDAIKYSFTAARAKAASLGIKVEGRSDEEVAKDILAVASPSQLAAMPENLSDVDKATQLLGAEG